MTVRFSPASIRSARIGAGLSQREAGEHAGVTASTVKNIESGRHEPKVELAARLAAAYGVDFDSLFIHDPEADTASPAHGKSHGDRTAVVEGSPAPAHRGG